MTNPSCRGKGSLRLQRKALSPLRGVVLSPGVKKELSLIRRQKTILAGRVRVCVCVIPYLAPGGSAAEAVGLPLNDVDVARSGGEWGVRVG